MYQAAAQRPFFPVFFGLLLVGPGAGCGKPGGDPQRPAFVDPPIYCNADLIRGVSQTLVTKQLFLPAVRDSHLEDYDGDGRGENQFRNLINIAELGGFAVRDVLQAENQAGHDLLLLDLVTTDFMQADCASLTVRHAKAPDPGAAPPKFDGTDVFHAADSAAMTFYGRIDNFVFQSLRPRDQQATQDGRLTLSWPITQGQTVAMPLRGVGITAILQADEHRRLVSLTQGSINGVQTAQSAADLLLPAVAQVLTDAIHSASAGDFRNDLISLLEPTTSMTSIRKCQVTADCCARAPSTCKILPAEVTESPVGGVLSPDVEVFDAAGDWRPVPGGRPSNGFSVGLGFEAVRATF